ncbi:hypothetical protein [Haloarchaeobius baliensis]|uniref:hypothetical protein n=1 Tax=Haloarchaeobius baliensis TaxID=1670458 RepID=UPI003F880BB9
MTVTRATLCRDPTADEASVQGGAFLSSVIDRARDRLLGAVEDPAERDRLAALFDAVLDGGHAIGERSSARTERVMRR